MRFLTHFHGSKKPLIIETVSSHVLDARDEIALITGRRPTSMSRIDEDTTISHFRNDEETVEFLNN